MQHLNKTKEFGRTASQRKALWSTMLGSLIMAERIETTEAKAKELKGRIDKLINKAKKHPAAGAARLAVRRDLKKYVPAAAAEKLMGEFLQRFESRKSGYTRVIKLAPRKSDNARLAIIEFV